MTYYKNHGEKANNKIGKIYDLIETNSLNIDRFIQLFCTKKTLMRNKILTKTVTQEYIDFVLGIYKSHGTTELRFTNYEKHRILDDINVARLENYKEWMVKVLNSNHPTWFKVLSLFEIVKMDKYGRIRLQGTMANYPNYNEDILYKVFFECYNQLSVSHTGKVNDILFKTFTKSFRKILKGLYCENQSITIQEIKDGFWKIYNPDDAYELSEDTKFTIWCTDSVSGSRSNLNSDGKMEVFFVKKYNENNFLILF